MNKLKLIADDLRVESFESSRADTTTCGTVRAHWTRLGEQKTCGGESCDYACDTVIDPTCFNICIS